MHTILSGDHRNLDKQTLALSRALGRTITWTVNFSRRARNAVFTYEVGESYNLFFPLQRAAYETVFVHASVDLYETSVSLDFLARAMNAVSPVGRLYLDPGLMTDTAGQGRLTIDMVRQLLGEPDEVTGGFWSYRGKKTLVAEDRSILGWYYDQRGTIVETNVTGGLVVGKSADIARAVFGNLVYPGDTLDTFPKRLPRKTIVDIVEKVRAGTLTEDKPAIVPELERVAYGWDWDSHGQKFRQYQESWENYLIPGNIYKAATIASLMRRLFPGRQDLSFLEHGGNAGLLTAQLLLDLQDMLALGVCCEIDIVPLLNALKIHRYYTDRLSGRMYVRNVSADSLAYYRKFSVVAFVHMLLYVRRDLLPDVLRRAWNAVEPGGILLVFENTAPPTTLTGVDADIVFFRDELEKYLEPFGEIEYALPGTGEHAEQNAGLTKPLFRFIRKSG
jgi:SAM-dependent methyltransferase